MAIPAFRPSHPARADGGTGLCLLARLLRWSTRNAR